MKDTPGLGFEDSWDEVSWGRERERERERKRKLSLVAVADIR